MKCKKCNSDALIKNGDWYSCANCGAEFFDTEVHVGNIESPTKQVENMEQNVELNVEEKEETVVEKADGDGNEKEKKSKLRETIDFFIPIVIAVIVAILLKTFVFANAVVPTGSMKNTIEEKDRIIASRLAYINSDPERYDVVIFKYPDDEEQCFVKRVIGLPGETVEVVNGIVYVTQTNGEVIQLDDSFVTNCIPSGDFGPYEVPEGCYFMMGDNRNNSWDSRYWTNKFVSKDKILGKVKFRYYPSIATID
jgi:signal peptidase I